MLDVTLPGFNGLELQTRVAVDRIDMPIIFITGYGDVPMTVRAMKAGALEFLTKPFDDDVLLRAIRHGHRAQPRGVESARQQIQTLRDCHASLSHRERRSHGVGRVRPVEQAGGRRARHQRDHGEGSPRQDDAKDEGALAGRSREHRCNAGPRIAAENPILHRSSFCVGFGHILAVRLRVHHSGRSTVGPAIARHVRREPHRLGRPGK